MADQNKTDVQEKFFSEILSPSELFSARSRTHKIPVRGQKEFFPDDSGEQRLRLEQSLKEHWSLVSEERVERQGNLVKARWIESEQIVELQSPAGKFWQTMGFSNNGKQNLQPEEALYLMECGRLQVSHRDLPLSIQDGYERFLSPGGVTLQQHQVFAHLKRLGYVVHRFVPSSEATPYARQLNLRQPRERAERRLKRKRGASPAPTPSRTEESEGPTVDGMEEEEPSGTRPPREGRGGAWWLTDVLRDQSDRQPVSARSRWSFGSIPFPDLGSNESPASTLLPPDPALLPGALVVGVCHIAPWRQRMNLQEENRLDGEVRRCKNWAEYRDLLARRQGNRRPAHLWNREVTPLHDPSRPIPTGELLDKISVVRSSHLLEGVSSIKASDEWRIRFDVYQPDSVSHFKKSSPGDPSTRVCVCSFDGAVPDLRVMKQLANQSGDVPVVFAVVDRGDISFYTFRDFQLPREVFP
ncbi:tRNA-splicing endonuclease subunit Sen54 [Brachionichthys hirsutus]|uniref:tRNA-splicing endonuclease subunit Sen54 n=1 Tax=Brachionichthys hirsutus TaxID=412623 RepID=UPI003604A1E0